METFIIRLAVAVIPLVVLVVSVNVIVLFGRRRARYPLSWHRQRRTVLRSLAAGVMLR